MAFVIKHGLFKLNITDHHAVLGVAINTDPKKIRLKYLKIAHKLHPDTCRKADAAEKKLAGKLLSQMINPAYEQLSRKNSYLEHQLVLTQIGKRLAEKRDKVNLSTEYAQQLVESGDQFEQLYPKLLDSLVKEQYQSLASATKTIGLISELNLAYLMLQQSKAINHSQVPTEKPPAPQPVSQTQSPPPPTAEKVSPKSTTPPQPEAPDPQVRVASYIRRAKQYMEQDNLMGATAELKDALKIDPNHGTVHALLGKIYLRQEQLTMAKIHVKKAAQANPKDPDVMESKKELDKVLKQRDRTSNSSRNKNAKTSESKSSNSGIFGSLFGAKKK